MIRRLTLDELIDAAKNLQSAEQIALNAAISQQLTTSGGDESRMLTPVAQLHADNCTALGIESLSRACGEQEPDYSEKDLVP
jgi:hypothetical protein